jgi:HK97 family phage major capsid protein
MAAKIHELRAKWDGLVKEANDALTAAQAKAEEEGRELTAEELAAQDAFDAKIKAASEAYHLEAKKNERLAGLGASGAPASPQVTDVRFRADGDPKRGFQSHRDFFLSCIEHSGLRDREHVEDERLKSLAVMDKEDKVAAGELAFMLPSAFTPKAAAGSDEQGEYSDTYGGFAVPTSRLPGLLQVGFEGDPTAGMTMSLPMATPSVEIMARTDKDHSTSVSGGFTVARRSETTAPSSSRMALEMIGLRAASLFGLAYATEEILQDSAISFAAMIDSGFRSQFGAHILNEKIRGGGGNEYHGILSALCKIQVSKETNQAADTIVFDNVNKMAARCWGYGNAVWLANHNTRPQLAKIALPVGTGGVAMYQPASVPGALDMLMGRPVIYSEYMSTLGDAGDIVLVNWSQFLEGTYQPIQGAESVHVRFVNHERTFKLWTRNCGAPWWRSALTPNKGDTLSPIITLAARA